MRPESGQAVRGGIRIRDAATADSVRLTRIAREAKSHWGYPGTWLAQWESTLTITPDFVRRHVVRVAEASGRPIGFHALVEGTGFWQLDHLWIEPAFHGRGIGRALFLDAVAQVRGRRRGIIRIEAEPYAAGFYERMGAVRVGAVPAPAPGAPDRTLPLFELRVEPERAVPAVGHGVLRAAPDPGTMSILLQEISMPTEMCPRCGQPRETTITRSTRSVTEAAGSTKRVRTDSYHCATCHAFVRSEEVDEPPEGGRDS